LQMKTTFHGLVKMHINLIGVRWIDKELNRRFSFQDIETTNY